MEISKTDLKRIVKYLSDAAGLYDRLDRRSDAARAWYIRQLIKKINKKFKNPQI